MKEVSQNSLAKIGQLERRLSDLAKSKSRIEVVNRLLTSLSAVAGLDNMAQHILDVLMETIGADNIVIVFHVDSAWQYRDIYGTSRLYQPTEDPYIDTVLSNGRPHCIDLSETNQSALRDGSSVPTETWIFPLVARERHFGAICMEGMRLNDRSIFDELSPFFVYAGLMLDNEISSYNRLAKAHRKLQESETLYRTLFDQSPDGIVLWALPELKPLQFNTLAHEQLGYSHEEFAQLRVHDIHCNSAQGEIEGFLETLRHGEATSFEATHRTKDGGHRIVSVALRVLQVEDRQMILAIHRDETESKKAEEEKALMSFALDNIRDAVYLLDENGRIKYVNEEACRALGYSREELIATAIPDIDPDSPTEKWSEYWRELKAQGSLKIESTHRRKNGEIFPVEVVANYFEYNDVEYSLALTRDISEDKRAEEERLNLEQQMQHTQKLESLGVLAGGIAHDFNNLLAAIMGHAELGKRRLDPQSPVINNLMQVEQAAERAADLAKQMLAYSGKGKFKIEHVDLNHLLNEMLQMLEVSITKRAVLLFNLSQPIPSVEADATQLRQIIMNLVINASEAIDGESGTIVISTGDIDCDRDYLQDVWLDENLPDGRYVYLEISDTGCGMDKYTQAKLFDPFFTTKFTGRGLGMSATLGIVRGHNGAIKVYSELGKGTTFKVLLPASDRPAKALNGELHTEVWQGSGRILLVDDEESIRGIGTEMLKELGFSVLTAENGREAIEIFKSDPDIALVILDLTMPQMDGAQCFRMLRQLEPAVRVVMSSGYNEYEVSQKFVAKDLSGFIQKPYQLSVLRDVLRTVMTD